MRYGSSSSGSSTSGSSSGSSSVSSRSFIAVVAISGNLTCFFFGGFFFFSFLGSLGFLDFRLVFGVFYRCEIVVLNQ